MQPKTIRPLHPPLLFIYFIFFYFDNNKEETYISDLYLPLIIGLGCTALLLAVFRLLLGTFAKAGILTSFFILLFFLYEDILNIIIKIPFGKNLLEVDKSFFITYSMIFLLVFIIAKYSKHSFSGTTRFLNLFSIILLTFPVSSLVFHQFEVLRATPDNTISSKNFSLPKHTLPEQKPDVYYIILDSYTNKKNLKHFFNFNNDEFISFLENKGFYVANESRSNYQNTNLSIPSSLNMDYHDWAESVKDASVVKSLFKNKIDYPKVPLIFRQLGYKTISYGRVHGKGNIYDQKLYYNRLLSPFTLTFLNKSIFKNFNLTFLDPNEIQRNSILYNFEQLKKVSEQSEPTFFYAHLMVPHPPWVFDRNGDLPNAEKTDKSTYEYVEQVMFVNKKIKKFLEYLLSNSKVQPIVIVQADHGFEPATSTKPNEEKLRRVFGILNAYYFPGIDNPGFYSKISPVNSFRLLFNKYFGMNFDFLPDKSYFQFPFSKHWQVAELPPLPKSFKDPKEIKVVNDLWIENLIKETEKKPEGFEGHFILGWNYFLTNQNEKAVKAIKKSIQLNPEFSSAYSSLARVYIKMKQYDGAMESLTKALELDPNNLMAKIFIGLLHLNSGNNQKVVELFSNPRMAASNYIEPHYILGRAFHNLKSFLQAIDSYKKALRINPWDYQTHYRLGITYEALENYSEAINSYKTSLSVRDWQKKTHLKLALAYEKINDHKNSYKYALSSKALSKTSGEDSELTEKANELIKRLQSVSPNLDGKQNLKPIDLNNFKNLIFKK